MTGNAALDELRSMKRPSRRKLDAVRSKHEGTPEWTRTAKKLHAQLVQDGGFSPVVIGRQASVAPMSVRGIPAPVYARAQDALLGTRTRYGARTANLGINTLRVDRTEPVRMKRPDVGAPCPSLEGATAIAEQLLMEAGMKGGALGECQQVVASIMAVAGLKMVINTAYADVDEAKAAEKEADKALKVMGQRSGTAVSDSWNDITRKAGLAVAVGCMGADATVSEAVGQYLG